MGIAHRHFLLIQSHVGACQPASRDALRIRPSGRARTAIDPSAAGAARAHAHAELLAQGDAGRASRELAARSAWQLGRALHLSRTHHRIQRHGRPARRTRGDQSVRLLRRALCGDLSVHAAVRPRARACAVPGDRARGRAARRVPGIRAAHADDHGAVSHRPQCARAQRRRLHGAAGDRHAHAG